MKLLNFSVSEGERRVGALTEAGVVDLTAGLAFRPTEILDLLRHGGDAFQACEELVQATRTFLSLNGLKIHAPIPRPGKFLGIGGNFRSHVAEVAHLGYAEPTTPIWFNKQTTCVTGPYDPIVKPWDSDQLDYEGELALVIGKPCRRVSVERALDYVAGYMVCNDVSVRDWQRASPTSTAGKSFDSHGPTGPCLVTPDEVGDPQSLRIQTWVNGERRQDGTTEEMIFSCAELIADVSRKCTLEVGDIISIGSPAGVGGVRNPPLFLRAGDTVRITVDRVGTIENPVVDEQVPASRGQSERAGVAA